MDLGCCCDICSSGTTWTCFCWAWPQGRAAELKMLTKGLLCWWTTPHPRAPDFSYAPSNSPFAGSHLLRFSRPAERFVEPGCGFNFCISLMANELGRHLTSLLPVWVSFVKFLPAEFSLSDSQSFYRKADTCFLHKGHSPSALVSAGSISGFAFDSGRGTVLVSGQHGLSPSLSRL